jgi:hypothetical protein
MKLKVGLLLVPEKSLNEAVEVLREKAQALKIERSRLPFTGSPRRFFELG